MASQLIRMQFLRLLLQQCQEEDLIQPQQRYHYIVTLLLEAMSEVGTPMSRSPNIYWSRGLAYEGLMKDYFIADSVYGADQFRRRFRMRKSLFERILLQVTERNDYFIQKLDAVGVQGFMPLQKMVAAIRMLAYDRSADDLDEYLRIGESTSLCCLKEFCKTVVLVFGPQYLRFPTVNDYRRILAHSARRGFPGMLGSLDCMHWQWKNCPRAWAGQFTGRSGSSSLILEAVATYDLWIWHSFFGMAGSNNDINVMDRSPLFTNLMQGLAPKVTVSINNRRYEQGYYLTDKIYPQWSVFVRTITSPATEKRKLFAKMQESAQKDIEHCFGVLQAQWAILQNPSRVMSRATLHRIMTTCVILHNMIVEDEQNCMSAGQRVHHEALFDVQPGLEQPAGRQQMLANRMALKNAQMHHVLQSDLVEHLWLCKGQQS